MGRQRKRFTPSEKVVILRRHFIDGVVVSDVCDEFNIHPTLFYRWQKTFFENGDAAFESESKSRVKKLERDLTATRQKIAAKDEVIAELLGEHMALKKSIGGI